MTKHKTLNADHHTDAGKSRTQNKRDISTGSYVIGHSAFAKISAVEGISPSKRLAADLHALKEVTSEERRLVLSGKYSKRS